MVLLGINFLRQMAKKKVPRANIPPRAHEGIWGGKRPMYGHVVTFSGKKTKRTWFPNIKTKTYYSEILEENMKYEFTTHAMRCIDKAGGFDNYIVNTKDKALESRAAILLKKRMLLALKLKEQGIDAAKVKELVKPAPKRNPHEYVPKVYNDRFYHDNRGCRKQMTYC